MTTKSAGKEEAGKLRKLVIDELVQTEKTYVQCLDNLIRRFMNPLLHNIDGKPLLSPSEHATIFPSDINTIYAFHSKILVELIKNTSKWNNDKSKIGHIFVKYGQMFKMYQTYMNNHHRASFCFSQMKRKNSKFAIWCDKTTRDNCNNYALDSLLILPIQRLPRYQLLIKELIKRTEQYDKKHIDLRDLHDAKDTITQVTHCINDRMKENDRRQKVGLIEARFDRSLIDKLGDNLVIPSRYFVAESSEYTNNEDYIIKHNKHGSPIAIVLFVFNDCMIYGHYDNAYASVSISARANVQSTALDSVRTLLFSRELLKFDHIMRFDELFQLQDVAEHEYKNLFCIKIFAREHSLWISFKTRQCKYKWLTRLTELNNKANNATIIKQIAATDKPSINIAYPLFVPDDYSICCLMCKQKFSLLIRRHHCYYCGTLACSRCTDCSLTNMWKKNEIVRVCTICHAKYKHKSGHLYLNLPMTNRASIWQASNDSMNSKLVPMLSPCITPRESPVLRGQIAKARTPPPIMSSEMNDILNTFATQPLIRQASLRFKTMSAAEIEEKSETKPNQLITIDISPANIYANTCAAEQYIVHKTDTSDNDIDDEVIINDIVIQNEDLLSDEMTNNKTENETNDTVTFNVDSVDKQEKDFNETKQDANDSSDDNLYEETDADATITHQNNEKLEQGQCLMCTYKQCNMTQNVVIFGAIVVVGIALLAALNRKRFSL